MATKYSIGDKVKVRDDLKIGKVYRMNSVEGEEVFVETMSKLCGREVTIKKIVATRFGHFYFVEEDAIVKFSWTDEMFEDILPKSEKNVYLYVHGDNDYHAEDFFRYHNAQAVYEKMITDGVTKYCFEDEHNKYIVDILEFGAIDEAYEKFVFNELVMYDWLKAADIFKVEPIK
ncbi:hypothetical protein M5X17_27705 [Paenibacillus alvei]|uniref:hypothetical protein n=1 Tax=Paenibacillus alvei TaxID=44250 RepID=UPI00227E7A9C|nr:hypothetical protein [Paenibacillus alvei]MCY9737492.1 hypothetical protein [Paenibacillus alvei]